MKDLHSFCVRFRNFLLWLCNRYRIHFAPASGINLASVFRGSVKQLRQNWNQLASDFLDYDYLKEEQDEITKKINWLYFKQNTPLTATIKTFRDVMLRRDLIRF